MTARNKANGAPLSEYFRSVDAGAEWHLFCRKCDKGWALKKSSNAIGNTLHLLNDARSHQAPA